MTKIVLDIKNCTGCPKVVQERTPRAGYAVDYFCSLVDNKLVSGYVEWESDLNPVPDWCPLLLSKTGAFDDEEPLI